MKMRLTIWAVHIYQVPAEGLESGEDRPGKYLRTIDATFTESSGREFCKVFNACGSCGRLGVVAVAKEHAIEVAV